MSTPALEVQYADGRVAQAAFWWFLMLQDPTQSRARKEAGYSSSAPMSAQQAFQETFESFSREVLTATQDPKYLIKGGQLVNAHTREPIPRDEPVFIFRAKDSKAQYMLELYASRCTDPQHVASVRERARHFGHFSLVHPERMKEPDTR